jgi:radical SAM protein with 4Fe4S-binding SPASM domain
MDFSEYRNMWATAGEKTPDIPLNIDLELSAACNLKCPFCFLQNEVYAKPEPKFMDTDFAKEVIDEAVALGVPSLKLNWRGEATIHQHFAEILTHAAKAEHAGHKLLDILLNTNGNYNPDITPALLNTTKIMFSVDSLNPDTYGKMRKGGDLPKVINNITDLISAGHKNIWVRRVITDDNRHEDFGRGVKALWGKGVRAAEHHCFERNGEQDTPCGRVYCNYPSQRLVISTSGKAYPCCVDYHETLPMGDLQKDYIETIWNSHKLNRLRYTLKAGQEEAFPKTCSKCASWMAYNDPRREMVQDKEI